MLASGNPKLLVLTQCEFLVDDYALNLIELAEVRFIRDFWSVTTGNGEVPAWNFQALA